MEAKSTFVTALAWVFIIGAGFALLGSVMQVIMVSTIFSAEELQTVPDGAPAVVTFMSQQLHFIVYGFGALTLFTFISAIALLQRKSWARVAFVIILTLGVVWQLGGIIMQLTNHFDYPAPPAGEGFEGIERMGNMIRWFSVAVALAVSGLFIGLIKKLVSRPIVDEFTRNDSDG